MKAVFISGRGWAYVHGDGFVVEYADGGFGRTENGSDAAKLEATVFKTEAEATEMGVRLRGWLHDISI